MIPPTAPPPPPPHSLETEQRALACMLSSAENVKQGLSILTKEHFHLIQHQDIFESMEHLDSKKKEISVVSIYDHLKARGRESITTLSYIMSIANMCVVTVSLEGCHEILQEKKLARSLVEAAQKHIKMAQHDDVQEILDTIRLDYDQIEKSGIGEAGKPLSELLGLSFMRQLKERMQQKQCGILSSGVPTGFKHFDEKVGGLTPSHLIIGAGRPGMGKTAFALNIMENIVVDFKRPVGFFSLEMSYSEVIDRLIGSQVNIPLKKIRIGDLTYNESHAIEEKIEELEKVPLIIDDSPYQTMATLSSKAIRMKTKHKIEALFIDYLQLIQGNRKGSENRYMEITEISRKLKCLAKYLNIPIVCLSQLSRSVEQRNDKTPQLSDLRDSGAIEQDADIVFFLYRKDYYNPYEQGSKIIIAKNRHGSMGTVDVTFDKNICQFKETFQKEAI